MANTNNMADSGMKVLIYGPSGTGKTTLAASFPDPHFVDFDNGMLSVRGKNINYITISNKETKDPDFIHLCGAAKCKQSGYMKGVALIEKWANELKAGQTLVIDSLTFMNDFALEHVLQLANQKTPRIQDWGAAQKLLEGILSAINDCECNIVVICHEQFVKDEESGFVSWLPLTIGKLATKLPVYFDEVWRTYTEQGMGQERAKTFYGIHTIPTRRSTAKSRLHLPAKIEMPTYDSILAAVGKR